MCTDSSALPAGHAYEGLGVAGNKEADMMAKNEAWMGGRMHKPDIVTPAGIRRAHPIHPKAPPHLQWSREAVRGLIYW